MRLRPVHFFLPFFRKISRKNFISSSFSSLSACHTLHKAPKSHPLDHFHHCATNQPPRPHPRPKTPDRLDLHTHRNHRITIVLSSSSRPLANPNLHAFRCSLNASKSPPEHHYLQTPKPSSHHPSSPPHIINQSPFSRSPSDPLTDPLHLSKTSL